MRIARSLLVLLPLAGLLLAACVETPPPNAATQQAQFTQAAQTVAVQLTLDAGNRAAAQLTAIAGETAVARLTELAAPPTPAPSPTPANTPTPSPTPTETPPPAAPCNRLQFVSDITFPDGSAVSPGQAFRKTWRLQNIGSCTWNSGYRLVFLQGDDFGTQSAPLADAVAPGGFVDASVNLAAPGAAGTYTGQWALRSDAGEVFGPGLQGEGTLVVSVRVLRSPSGPVNQDFFDLAANYCSADWSSGSGLLPCPGDEADRDGSVILVNRPSLEGRATSGLGLWVRLNRTGRPLMQGIFPTYRVARGDRFTADAGCLGSVTGCNVIFQVDVRTTDGAVTNLGVWNEISDGQFTRINLDLSDFAGRSVQIILTVVDNGGSGVADAVWSQPRIQVSGALGEPALVWHFTEGVSDGCDELYVYLYPDRAGLAVARSCASQVELGRAPLTAGQYNRITGWIDRYSYYDTRGGPPSPADGSLTWVIFNGQGATYVDNSVLAEIDQYLASLFFEIAQ